MTSIYKRFVRKVRRDGLKVGAVTLYSQVRSRFFSDETHYWFEKELNSAGSIPKSGI